MILSFKGERHRNYIYATWWKRGENTCSMLTCHSRFCSKTVCCDGNTCGWAGFGTPSRRHIARARVSPWPAGESGLQWGTGRMHTPLYAVGWASSHWKQHTINTNIQIKQIIYMHCISVLQFLKAVSPNQGLH